MELIFIDETSDSKFKSYVGLCVAVMNSTHYKKVKTGFQNILRDSQWDESIEFKGAYLFSAKNGDTEVEVSDRVDICEKVIDLNISNKNARFRFYYGSVDNAQDQKQAYLDLLPKLLSKALPKAKKGGGKDVVAINCDYRSDITPSEIFEVAKPVTDAKGYVLYEDIVMPNSNFETVGVLYADIVGFLAARIETISNDSQLFDNIPPEMLEHNGKIKKLKSSTRIIDKVKRIEWHKIK